MGVFGWLRVGFVRFGRRFSWVGGRVVWGLGLGLGRVGGGIG